MKVQIEPRTEYKPFEIAIVPEKNPRTGYSFDLSCDSTLRWNLIPFLSGMGQGISVYSDPFELIKDLVLQEENINRKHPGLSYIVNSVRFPNEQTAVPQILTAEQLADWKLCAQVRHRWNKWLADYNAKRKAAEKEFEAKENFAACLKAVGVPFDDAVDGAAIEKIGLTLTRATEKNALLLIKDGVNFVCAKDTPDASKYTLKIAYRIFTDGYGAPYVVPSTVDEPVNLSPPITTPDDLGAALIGLYREEDS